MYEEIGGKNGVPVRAWVSGVPFEEEARRQLLNISRLPILGGHIAAMPDVHMGKGATVGSVIPTVEAIIPAAVGVDIGCGMIAVRTGLDAQSLPDNLGGVRRAIEQAVPHGRTSGRRSDKGSWQSLPPRVVSGWDTLRARFDALCAKHSVLRETNNIHHLGTLGTGNHFIEVCLDEADQTWFMLHSGSRGVGNRIGTYFIELARKDMGTHLANLPDRDLAYLREGTRHFDDYVEAVGWAQAYAHLNREIMMANVVEAVRAELGLDFEAQREAVNCHHNYVNRERHFGREVWLTRKGAVSAKAGELGIIPGSMGARSYIVRGLGNPQSYHSCSHGAGRAMSRTRAKKTFSLDDHRAATAGVECRKDAGVIDETPGAYKSIDAVMHAQQDLVEVVHTLRQVVCVKG